MKSSGFGANSSFPLLTLPFVFTQDDLLDSKGFIKEAKNRGYDLSHRDLLEFHRQGLLAPLFRIDDDVRADMAFQPAREIGNSFEVRALRAAKDGQLRDPADEKLVGPYEGPAKSSPDWWNGYLYSPWQLLDLHRIPNLRDWVASGRTRVDLFDDRSRRSRDRTRALVALSSHFLPGIIGQFSQPFGLVETEYREFRQQTSVSRLLEVAGLDPADLAGEGHHLLIDADSRDPLREWLPLIRHSNYSGWFKLKGLALHCIWLRIGAEVLLRAHEELSETRALEPLPSYDLNSRRLRPPANEMDTLDEALGRLGLSPHPRVLLLLEGETEYDHIPKLLAVLGIDSPDMVRIQLCNTSNIGAHLITRYGVAPRLGKKHGDIQLLDRHPTALIIAVDPDPKWDTQDKRDAERLALQNAIRMEVELQGGEIGQDDLEFLVKIRVWGDDKYEIANFTDDELVPVLSRIADVRNNPRRSESSWEEQLRAQLQEARARHADIKVPMRKMGMREDKVMMAEMLRELLIDRFSEELKSSRELTKPVYELVLEVYRTVVRLSGPGFSLQKIEPPTRAEEV
jgi:hypothetical protein